MAAAGSGGARTPPMEQALIDWGAALAPARLAGGTVPDPPHPLTLEQGYAVAARQEAELGTPAGWKIGATSAGAMAFLRIGEPIRGRLFAERLWHHGSTAPLAGDRPAEAEPEVAFLLARDLLAGQDPRAAIAELRAAAEIVRPSHSRAFELGAGFIVADNAAGLGALLGPPLPPSLLDTPAALCIALQAGDARTEGSADAVLGNPLEALAWLARTLGRVPAGSWVLSGAMARAVPLPPSGQLFLDAGPHGRAALRLA